MAGASLSPAMVKSSAQTAQCTALNGLIEKLFTECMKISIGKLNLQKPLYYSVVCTVGQTKGGKGDFLKLGNIFEHQNLFISIFSKCKF